MTTSQSAALIAKAARKAAFLLCDSSLTLLHYECGEGDFYCVKHMIVIEVDGGIHENQQDYDRARERYLHKKGFTVLRFPNEEVLTDFSGALYQIVEQLSVSLTAEGKG